MENRYSLRKIWKIAKDNPRDAKEIGKYVVLGGAIIAASFFFVNKSLNKGNLEEKTQDKIVIDTMNINTTDHQNQIICPVRNGMVLIGYNLQ